MIPGRFTIHTLPGRDNRYRSTHISASLPQLVQVAEPFTLMGSCVCPAGALSAAGADSSGKEQVKTISASLPQFSHLQTCLTFFVWPLIINLLVSESDVSVGLLAYHRKKNNYKKNVNCDTFTTVHPAGKNGMIVAIISREILFTVSDVRALPVLHMTPPHRTQRRYGRPWAARSMGRPEPALHREPPAESL